MPPRLKLEPFIQLLKELPFVATATLTAEPTDERADARLTLGTAQGMYEFVVEAKGAYLTQTLINALAAQKDWIERRKPKIDFIVFAPYIPQPVAEQLIRKEINFVDAEGNIHLAPHPAYHFTRIGYKRRQIRQGFTGAPMAQIQFVLLTKPDAVTWPIRRLGEAAGVGKTHAANIKRKLIGDRLLTTKEVVEPKVLEEKFLAAYADVLRPNLLIGTFRAQETDTARLVLHLDMELRRGPNWALTGAAAEFQLENFYRGQETTLFIDAIDKDLQRRLKLLPDPKGPVTLLRLFGNEIVWREDPLPLAHPLLIYAELLYKGGPRELEAAQTIKENYLR